MCLCVGCLLAKKVGSNVEWELRKKWKREEKRKKEKKISSSSASCWLLFGFTFNGAVASFPFLSLSRSLHTNSSARSRARDFGALACWLFYDANCVKAKWLRLDWDIFFSSLSLFLFKQTPTRWLYRAVKILENRRRCLISLFFFVGAECQLTMSALCMSRERFFVSERIRTFEGSALLPSSPSDGRVRHSNCELSISHFDQLLFLVCESAVRWAQLSTSLSLCFLSLCCLASSSRSSPRFELQMVSESYVIMFFRVILMHCLAGSLNYITIRKCFDFFSLLFSSSHIF